MDIGINSFKSLHCQTANSFLSSNFSFFYMKIGVKTCDGFVFTKKLLSAGSTLVIHLVIDCLLLSLLSFLCWYLWGVGKGAHKFRRP